MSRYDKEINCDFEEEIAIAQKKIAMRIFLMKAVSMPPYGKTDTDLEEEKNNFLDSEISFYEKGYEEGVRKLLVHKSLNLVGVMGEEKIFNSRRCADGYSDDYFLIGVRENIDIFVVVVKKIEGKESFQLKYVGTLSEERPR